MRDHAQHGQDHLAHFAPGRHEGVENRDERASLLALVHNVQHVAGVAAEPVDPSSRSGDVTRGYALK
jgi:hypothetical protein